MLRPTRNVVTILQRVKECNPIIRCSRQRSDVSEYECKLSNDLVTDK